MSRPDLGSIDDDPKVADRSAEVAVDLTVIDLALGENAANRAFRPENEVAVVRAGRTKGLRIQVGKPILVQAEPKVAPVHLLGQPERPLVIEPVGNDRMVVSWDLRVLLHDPTVSPDEQKHVAPGPGVRSLR